MGSYDPSSLSILLPVYYKRLFPFKQYYNWLCYGQKPGAYFAYREFAFILRDDVYLRYKTYLSQAELEGDVQRLVPEKIDIGPVFSHRPSEKNRAVDFAAKERELVFDIDLTDYDDVRSCCQGGAVCGLCWRFMVIAVRVLERALKEDFGFRHLLFVFSGRRGIHCWVCDEAARKLTNDGRSAVAEYLQLISGGENQKKKVNLGKRRALHPSIRKAVAVMAPEMDALAEEQGWMADEASMAKVLQLVPDETQRSELAQVLGGLGKAGERWRALRLATDAMDGGAAAKFAGKPRTDAGNRFLWQEIVLQLAYPRLDINVTKGTNHLLKSPFVVHPKTGKVAVPLVAANVHLFDTERVPTISQLVDELAEVKENADGSKKQLDYKRTSLVDYVDNFAAFVDSIQADSKSDESDKRKAEDMDF